MFIEFLKIYKGNVEIRSITFHKGVNLIVDNTPFSKGTKSGNSVGKTTVLRLIDYCLGSDGKDIYSDTEFKSSKNNELKSFLENENVLVKLGLIDKSNNRYTIERNFLSRKAKVISFDDEIISIDELRLRLNKLFFNNNSTKPSFRQLISKFIRNTPHKMSKTLRYLHGTTNDIIYESVHLFLFGVAITPELILEKSSLESKITSENNILSKITEDGNTENSLKQALLVINRDIQKLEKEKENFNIGINEENDINQLNEVKYKISKLAIRKSEKNSQLNIVKETINDLKNNKNSYDTDVIKDIYNEAKLYIPNLQKRFEEVVDFHNSMLENKIKFLSKDIPELNEKISRLEKRLSRFIKKEYELSQKLNFMFKIEDYHTIINDLHSKYELKGNKEERYNQVIELTKSINEKTERLEFVNGKLGDLEPMLESNVTIFNEYFSDFSRKLYNEEFFLSYENRNGNYKFDIQNIQANVGGGKKKGQIAAFDLAYIKFCDRMNIPSPRFILHDSTEDVSINQLMIINDIANSIDCQYIVAILADKFNGNAQQAKMVEQNKVISLQQNDKLFRF